WRVMRLVEAPQVPIPVLPAVHPVDIEVVADEEDRHLKPHRPVREQLEPRKPADGIEPRDDDREDDDAQDVALRDGIEREIVEKPFAQELLTPAVWNDPLEEREQHR